MLKRVLFVFVATVIGGLVGAWSSWHFAVTLDKERIAAASVALLAQANELDREVNATLDRFEHQPDAFCSREEFAQMRYAVYATHYIKDILRVRPDLACAASLQADTPSPGPLRASGVIDTADGRKVSSAEALLLLAAGVEAPVIARKETRVALDPFAFRSARRGTTIAYRDATNARLAVLYGEVPALAPHDWLGNTTIERHGTLYAPLCDRSSPLCVVSRESKSTLFDAQWPMLAVSTLLGLIAGGAIGSAILIWSLRQLAMDARLCRAIDRDLLEVAYQPVVRISDGVVVGAEALVRWQDLDGRFVPPTRFIPLAEQIGCISAITLLVIRHVIRDFAPALRAPTGFRININFSSHDLADKQIHKAMADLLDEAGIAAERLGIELTEHSVADSDIAIEGTRQLSKLGHPIYIDDFGTGYSSLSSLTNLQIDVLKVDRTFTSTIDSGGMKVSLVPQIIQMAQTLGLGVVVEGVETQAQADYLRQFGDDVLAQGWLYGRALSADAFTQAWPVVGTAATVESTSLGATPRNT